MRFGLIIFSDCLTNESFEGRMPEKNHLFSPIHSRRAFEQVSMNIKDLIFQGVLKPGDKLPSEAHLASQFNVGRQTIREALRLLELSGFIVIHKGGAGGPIIADTVINKISDLFLDAFRMRNITMEELTVARFEIEKVILDFVVKNASLSDIEALRENVYAAKSKIENDLLATEENIQFHRLLAKASKNQVFVITLEAIVVLVGDFFSHNGPNVETSGNVVRYHEAILEAIEAKDRKRSLQLLEQHIPEVHGRINTLTTKNARP